LITKGEYEQVIRIGKELDLEVTIYIYMLTLRENINYKAYDIMAKCIGNYSGAVLIWIKQK